MRSRAIVLVFVVVFSLSAHSTISPPSPLAPTVLRLDPATVEIGPGYSIGETFTLAAKIDDVEDLAGLGLEIKWNTTYLEYVSHTMMIPVEDHPGGIMHEPVLVVADSVNETKGTYVIAVAVLGGPTFNGSGIAFEITFSVKHQPAYQEPDVNFLVKFTIGDLAPSACGGIPHTTENCNVTIHAYSPTVVRFDPSPVVLGPAHCVGDTFTLAARIDDVENLAGIGLQIVWNTTYFEYVSHTMTIPVESYFDGILHSPILIIDDPPDVMHGIYDVAVSTFGGAPFNGSGKAFEITLRLKHQPLAPEPDVTSLIKFTLSDLTTPYPSSIPHATEHGSVTILAYPNWSIADLNWDLKVDIADIILACEAYGSTPEEANWNLLVDVAPLWNRIDIFDLATIASHYGEEYLS